MPENRFIILSTALLPSDKLPVIPDSVDLRVVPFIRVSPCQDENLRVHALLKQKIIVIFTSPQAVSIVQQNNQIRPDWTVYCIQNETCTAVEQWLGKNSIRYAAKNAETLAEKIIADQVRDAVFFCGRQRLNTLPDRLRKEGIFLREVILYETYQTPVKIEETPSLVLFFSPSAVKSFFTFNQIEPATRIIAIGTTTAAELKKNTNNPITISPEADKAFIINLAVEMSTLPSIS
jgi:uroporphyrinogen-III synthase